MFHFISRQINSRTWFFFIHTTFCSWLTNNYRYQRSTYSCSDDIYVRELKPRVNLVINIMLHCSFFSVSSHKDVWKGTHNHSLTHCLVLCERDTQSFSHSLSGVVWEGDTIVLSLTVWCCMRGTHNRSLTHCLVLYEKNTQSFSHSLSGAISVSRVESHITDVN